MDKILYISFLNEDIRPGYKNKIHSQAIAFSELKGFAILLILGLDGLHQYEFVNGKQLSKQIIPCSHKRKKDVRNIYDEFFSFRDFYMRVLELAEKNNFEIVYIRRIVPITPMLISMMRKLKSQGSFLIYEYPTYPWESEMKNGAVTLPRKLFYAMDLFFYKKLIEIPDMITYVGLYSGDDNRFFKIQNCGLATLFPCRLENPRGANIHLIGVAHVSHGHGYDLVIEALHEYYQQTEKVKVYFHIVGNTDGVPELEEMTKKYGLEEYVVFHGYTVGKELDELYQMADIGVNSVRIDNQDPFKVGLTTLKTVEYTFRGLPQISGASFMIDRNKTDIPPFLLVQTNKVNILEAINFYNDLKVTPDEIRQYAIQHMSWNKVFSEMLEKIKKIRQV